MFKIYWKSLAEITFSQEMIFILSKWNQKEVDKFAFLVDENLSRIVQNPFIGQPIKSIYKVVISKQTTLYYKVIESDKFDKIIQSCLYSSYAIDWNIFKEFKKDFWKEFI